MPASAFASSEIGGASGAAGAGVGLGAAGLADLVREDWASAIGAIVPPRAASPTV